MGAIRAALVLMKISHFDRTPLYQLDQYIQQKRPVFYMDCAALNEFWIMLTDLLEACSFGTVCFVPILILESSNVLSCLLIGLCLLKISFVPYI